MTSWIAKAAMIVSFLFYLGFTIYDWAGQLFGWHNEIWEIMDLPQSPESPANWSLMIGFVLTLTGLAALGFAYVAVWRILDGGKDQDFRTLSRNMRRLSLGLCAFWAVIVLLPNVITWILLLGLTSPPEVELVWELINIEIVFLIVAITILAISDTMERAWRAEDENRHFL